MRNLLAYLLLGLILFSCNQEPSTTESVAIQGTDPMLGKDRPLDPWVFRSVLDKKPRMLTLALNAKMWAAYSTQSSSLYKLWDGGVNLDGAVYTTVHGPQPSSIGDAYILNENDNTWEVLRNGQLIPDAKVQYKGHAFKKGQVTLKYAISLGTESDILIEEQPEFEPVASGAVKFARRFVCQNVPEGYSVRLNGDFAENSTHDNLESSGQLISENILGLNSNDTTMLTMVFVGAAKIANKNKIVDKNEPAGLKLINRSDCRSCHNENLKTVGPSYNSVAQRYDNTEANVSMLMNRIRIGGTGVWGGSVMNAHPDISEEDLKEMVHYVMSLDADEEKTNNALSSGDSISQEELIASDKSVKLEALTQGAHVKVYPFEGERSSLNEFAWGGEAKMQDVIAKVDLAGDDFGKLEEKFALEVDGYIKVDKTQRMVLRIASDDGSRLYINGKEVIDNDGLHGTESKDAPVALEQGLHSFKIQFFENGGGQSLYLMWRSADTGEFVTVPPSAIYYKQVDGFTPGKVFKSQSLVKGDQTALDTIHPSYTMGQARPDDFKPRVGGLDMFDDGRVAVSTWDALGAVYIVDGTETGMPSQMTARKIASGLAEPLGLAVVDDEIYIMQKQELTKLVDSDKDGFIDEYQVLCNAWDVTANFHEFGFGLAYKEGYFYATLATGIQPGGASALNQPKHRGSAIRVHKDSGAIEFLANGLRTPNGIGLGVDNEVFVADNQGDWLPASKIVHVSKGAWFGSRSVDFEGTAGLKEKKPVVWLPQNEIGNSPSTPLALNDGPYTGQMIHGEVTHGGIKRVYVEKVNGEYQGCVFRFMQGLEAGVNRLQWAPDGSLYAGGVGSTGNWGHDKKLWYGLQRMVYNGNSTFEMLSVSARSNGIELTFTEALEADSGNYPKDYEIRQWYYLPTKEYGGPKLDEQQLDILSVNVSSDRKKVFLELDGMKEDHVIYVHLLDHGVSAEGRKLWSTEAWYTMNSIPKNLPGAKKEVDLSGMNVLTNEEKAAGWSLLFDGKTTKGWRNFKKKTIGSSWKVVDGCLTLMSERRTDGTYGSKDGGDIITNKTYKDYELHIEWKISECGNSGIIYNVSESADFDNVWQTGPEMQVLDNSCHPDAKIIKHRAGDLYDMISCNEETVLPSNQWNQARLKVQDGKVEHWLNGKKVVSFEMFTPEWTEMIANSKFKDMKGFGTFKRGHISLQDHDDRVAYRNIKIREL